MVLDIGIVARVEASPAAVSCPRGAETVAASLETASEIKLGWGGRRPGAGRPRGSRTRKRPSELLAIGPRWYCVHTRYPIEDAEASLVDLEFEAFVPRELVMVERIKSGRRVRETVARPLFGPYAFVRLDLADPTWRYAATANGVRCIFGKPERPTPLPIGLVEALIVRAGPSGVIDERPTALRLTAIQVGSRVRILDGPMAELPDPVGIVQMSTDKRVEMLLGMLRVTVDRGAVEEVA